MSPFVQLVLLTVTSQLGGALASYAKKAGAATGLSPEQQARYQVLAQIGTNIVTAVNAGMSAAAAEFTTGQTQQTTEMTGEKAVVAALKALPPIT